MKIKRIETFKVPPRWCFVRLETQSGIVGWGESIVEGRASTVETCVQELSHYLLGKDARYIEDIWQVLYRGGFYRGGAILTSAQSGIDQALWDIKGKYHNAPIHELLGGKVRDKMKVYCWIGGDRPSDTAKAAKQKLKEGYKAIKLNGAENHNFIEDHVTIQKSIETIQAIRDAVGYDLEIGVDFHGRVHRAMAKVLIKELEPFKLMFIEEPILCENIEYYKELQRVTTTPLATGERNYTRWGFKQILEDRAVDIIQPDPSHAGGISEVKKIATMAEAYDVALAPHCPLGPIALAACLQIDFTSINAFIQEQSLGIHYNKNADIHDYLLDPSVFIYEEGYVNLLEKPGLGIEINEKKVREAAKVGHNWKNPIWRNEDGSIAEW